MQVQLAGTAVSLAWALVAHAVPVVLRLCKVLPASTAIECNLRTGSIQANVCSHATRMYSLRCSIDHRTWLTALGYLQPTCQSRQGRNARHRMRPESKADLCLNEFLEVQAAHG